MARRSRSSYLKREREHRKAEKAARKRDRRSQRRGDTPSADDPPITAESGEPATVSAAAEEEAAREITNRTE